MMVVTTTGALLATGSGLIGPATATAGPATGPVTVGSVTAGSPGDSGGVPTLTIRAAALRPWSPADPVAVTYDPDLAPAGASIAVGTATQRHSMVVLWVAGLRPLRHYGAHVHVHPCGPVGADAGPHYQDVPDPVQPSVDPAYANPHNEVWLDLVTDPHGYGVAVAVQPWAFRPGGAQSVVLHESATMTGPGHAGTAGRRIACLTIPL
jgi:Cu-Zn family superoxide dismutase